jgi:hypothetical protein
MTLFHGGIGGKRAGDILVPSEPHVVCDCPVCEARADGRVCTVAEYRIWAMSLGERGRPILELLRDAAPFEAVDPPSGKAAVYITTDLGYARWYAARSQGDLYVVEPIGGVERSHEDPFPSWTCPSARVVRVVERRVRLDRRDRRHLHRRWKSTEVQACAGLR